MKYSVLKENMECSECEWSHRPDHVNNEGDGRDIFLSRDGPSRPLQTSFLGFPPPGNGYRPPGNGYRPPEARRTAGQGHTSSPGGAARRPRAGRIERRRLLCMPGGRRSAR
jgi:hypothetical protein